MMTSKKREPTLREALGHIPAVFLGIFLGITQTPWFYLAAAAFAGRSLFVGWQLIKANRTYSTEYS